VADLEETLTLSRSAADNYRLASGLANLGVNQMWAVAGHRLMMPDMPLNWDNDLP